MTKSRRRDSGIRDRRRYPARESALARAREERRLARIGDGAHADSARVGDRSGLVECGRLAVETTEQERFPHLADGIDVGALPGQLSGGARVIAGDAAQHAFAGKVSVHEGGADLRLADVVQVVGVVEGLGTGRLERRVGAVDVGDIDVDRHLAANPVGAVGGHVEDAVEVEHRRTARGNVRLSSLAVVPSKW